MNVQAYLENVCVKILRKHMFEADTQAARNKLCDELQRALHGETAFRVESIEIHSLEKKDKHYRVIELVYVTPDNLRNQLCMEWPL